MLGLGNPGPRYAATRHNVGVRVVKTLVERWKARPAEGAHEYEAWQAAPGGRAVTLMRTRSYMNESGKALLEWRAREELDLEALLVVADDVYLPVVMVRLRKSGSSGGHRGLESIEATLGTREFARLRIGVGAAPSEVLGDHVLDEFGEDEQAKAAETTLTAADAVECWVGEGILAAMNRFNRRVRKEELES